MTPGAKRSSTPRKARRVDPSAELRLRTSFPEVWAWYELIVQARGPSELEPSQDEHHESPRRSSARH